MQLIAKNKTIDTSPIYYLLIEGEHNADNIDFVVDRYYSDDVSVEDCTFIIKGLIARVIRLNRFWKNQFMMIR